MRWPRIGMGLALLLLFGSVVLADTAQELNERAVALYEAKKFEKALPLFRKARDKATDDPVIRKNLANCLAQLGFHELREGAFERARRRFVEGERLDDRVLFPWGIGLAEYRLGEWQRAIAPLNRALRADRDHAPSHELLGRIHYGRNENDLALKHLEAARRLDPDRSGLSRLIEKIRHETQFEKEMGHAESPHFRIRYDGDKPDVERLVRKLLEDAAVEVGLRLNIWPDKPIPVILYPDRDFHKATGLHAWAGGAFDGKIRLPVRELATTDAAALRRVVLHEVTHACLHRHAPELPVWLHEGLAQCMEDRPVTPARETLRKALDEGRTIPRIDDLPKSFAAEANRRKVQIRYAVVHAFCRHLIDRHGWSSFLVTLEELGRDRSLDEAIRRGFSLSLNELEETWRRALLD